MNVYITIILSFHNSSFTLAESYYAPYLLLVAQAFQSGDFVKAEKLQNRLNEVQSLVSQGKDVMKMFGK